MSAPKQPDALSGNLTIDRILLRKARFVLHQEEEGSAAELRARISSEALQSEGDQCSVRLTVRVDRMADEKRIFECEVCYEGNFTIAGLGREERHRLLLTRCLDILYPHAHAQLVQCAHQAGFRDVYLTPIHFDSLYQSHQQEQGQDADFWDAPQGKVVRH